MLRLSGVVRELKNCSFFASFSSFSCIAPKCVLNLDKAPLSFILHDKFEEFTLSWCMLIDNFLKFLHIDLTIAIGINVVETLLKFLPHIISDCEIVLVGESLNGIGGFLLGDGSSIFKLIFDPGPNFFLLLFSEFWPIVISRSHDKFDECILWWSVRSHGSLNLIHIDCIIVIRVNGVETLHNFPPH